MLQRNQPAGIRSETALLKYPLLRGFCFYHWLCSCVWNLQGNLFPDPLWFGFLCIFLLILSQYSDLLHYFLCSPTYFFWLFLVYSHLYVQNSSVWNSFLRTLAEIGKVVIANTLTFSDVHRDFLWYCLRVLGGACQKAVVSTAYHMCLVWISNL